MKQAEPTPYCRHYTPPSLRYLVKSQRLNLTVIPVSISWPFTGTNFCTTALIDSGASTSFICASLVEKAGIPNRSISSETVIE
jgi:peroxiredoxin